MSVYRKQNSPFYHFDFQLKGRRFSLAARTMFR